MAGCALVLTVAILAAAGDCGGGAHKAGPAVPQQNVQLKVGQSAPVEGTSLVIGFEAVSSDSRCPKGENCFWEGDATVQIWVRRADGTQEKRELHTASSKPRAAGYEGFSIRLVTLAPYPFNGRSISPADYVVTLALSHGSPPSDDEVV
jgi:hypothetical protein